MDAEVILVIKSANQGFSDHRVEYHTEWTVLDLKREISKTHPGIPSIPEQRLIYSGQLLQDHLTLKEVLRHPPENHAYTIHMVSSSPRKPPEANLPENQTRDSSILQSQVETNSESSTDGVRRRIIASESSPVIQPQGIDSPALYPHFSQVPSSIQGISDPLQQMAAMQQMYAQYMASYMQYMQMPPQMSQGNFYTSVNNETTDQSNITQPPQVLANNPQPAQVVPNRVAAPPGGGVGEDEEEGVPRDWLDYVYYASRLGVLISIVYFYSTFTRFLLIILIFVGFYLYQSGWFLLNAGGAPPRNNNNQDLQRGQPEREEGIEAGVRQPEPNPPPPDNQPGSQGEPNRSGDAAPQTPQPIGEVNPVASQNDEPVNRTATSMENTETSADGEEAVSSADDVGSNVESDVMSEELLLNERPSILTLSWTFLTTFFTSLIPENNQIIA